MMTHRAKMTPLFGWLAETNAVVKPASVAGTNSVSQNAPATCRSSNAAQSPPEKVTTIAMHPATMTASESSGLGAPLP